MKKVYLAARFPQRGEMESYVPLFTQNKYNVIARWVFGGEEGLTREDIAVLDLEDVDKCDVFVLFTQPYGTLVPGGGRFVEFGYAIAKGKEIHVIGDRENVFMHTPGVSVHNSLTEFFRATERQVAQSDDSRPAIVLPKKVA